MKGKSKSRKNSLKHGATAVLLVCENAEEERTFAETLSQLHFTYEPAGPLEEIVLEEIAGCYLKLGRCARWEQQLLQTRQSPAVRGMLEKFMEKASLLSLPIPGTDSQQSHERGPSGMSFPWACSELHMRINNYEQGKRYGSPLAFEKKEDMSTDRLEMEVRLEDVLDTVRRYERSIKKDLYRAMDQLEKLREARK